MEMHQCVEHRLWPRRAPWNIHIDRYDLIDPRDRGVIVVESTRRGASAERDDPFWFRHLLVDPTKNRGELMGDRAYNEQKIRLAGCEAGERCTEAIGIVVGAAYRHELHAAARGDEWVREERILSSPPDRGLKGCEEKGGLVGSW